MAERSLAAVLREDLRWEEASRLLPLDAFAEDPVEDAYDSFQVLIESEWSFDPDLGSRETAPAGLGSWPGAPGGGKLG